MDLEPQTLEHAGDRCEECGARLTAREQQVVLERGGPTLCAIHLADIVGVGDQAEGESEV